MRQFLEHATGLSIYPLISFVLFGLFFLAMLGWMFSRSKAYYHEVETIPFLSDDTQNFPRR